MNVIKRTSLIVYCSFFDEIVSYECVYGVDAEIVNYGWAKEAGLMRSNIRTV
jgi:hypothetical protein